MTASTTMTIYALSSVIIFCIGLLGLISHPHMLRKIISLNIMAGGSFLFLISLAYQDRSPEVDPVPQAMVLTGIVVAVSATAFALSLARRIREKTGRSDLEWVQEKE
ncbi:sodium:proton antiporter [Desulfonatronovibrio hydrogenovorans]|uniref:sodium:proton antiporter n=1 Tax=Desulfonatronovibrio hydrogenovorans TaxID=53245 RepID=UPI00048AEF53|nr:cation:proton antiporter subunit C [Desulfonatronovibrio hydrogenovorans]